MRLRLQHPARFSYPVGDLALGDRGTLAGGRLPDGLCRGPRQTSIGHLPYEDREGVTAMLTLLFLGTILIAGGLVLGVLLLFAKLVLLPVKLGLVLVKFSLLAALGALLLILGLPLLLILALPALLVGVVVWGVTRLAFA
jgi:hypothetical protein